MGNQEAVSKLQNCLLETNDANDAISFYSYAVF